MIVEGLGIEGFTVHESTQLTFPKRGVVLVTGPNGAGKSSIVEGVAWAGFGKTLRGTTPTREGSAVLLTPLLTIERERTKTKTRVKLAHGSVADTEKAMPQFDTATKAQPFIEAQVGTFEAWRRSHVFSSADAAHFTEATDKERKLFLEAWQGLLLDPALQLCRQALQQAMREADGARSALLNVEQKLAAAEQRIFDFNGSLGALPEAPPYNQLAVAHLKQLIVTTEDEVIRLQDELGKKLSAGGAHGQEASTLGTRLKRLEKGSCDACGQLIPPELIADVRSKVDALRQAAQAAQAAVSSDIDGLVEQLDDERRTLSRLRERAQAAAKNAGAREAAERARRQAEQGLKQAQDEAQTARGKLETLRAEIQAADRLVVTLRAAEDVLGYKGVRAVVLARVLKALEAAGNAWLPRLAGPGLKLELKAYSEREAGHVADAISLQVHGAGGGEGYFATSGGERRRINVALLLAFSGAGTLFFDEVFDALDAAGVEAVVKVVGELAQERCVVVVTHNEDLAARLPHAVRWRVAGGKVTA